LFNEPLQLCVLLQINTVLLFNARYIQFYDFRYRPFALQVSHRFYPMPPIADFLFQHTGTQPGSRKLYLVATDVIGMQPGRDWNNNTLITTLTVPLVVLPQYEHRTLVHAIAILYARGLFPQVTIDGGDNPRLLSKVQALASALSVKGQIRFIDENTQAPSVSSSYQILAITPHDQEMPAILAEGMAAGCALVGSTEANCAQAMIENGVNGHLVPPLNPQALASVLEKLLRDTSYTQRLGQAGKARAGFSH
jgi:hypothetical protein